MQLSWLARQWDSVGPHGTAWEGAWSACPPAGAGPPSQARLQAEVSLHQGLFRVGPAVRCGDRPSHLAPLACLDDVHHLSPYKTNTLQTTGCSSFCSSSPIRLTLRKWGTGHSTGPGRGVVYGRAAVGHVTGMWGNAGAIGWSTAGVWYGVE